MLSDERLWLRVEDDAYSNSFTDHKNGAGDGAEFYKLDTTE